MALTEYAYLAGESWVPAGDVAEKVQLHCCDSRNAHFFIWYFFSLANPNFSSQNFKLYVIPQLLLQ